MFPQGSKLHTHLRKPNGTCLTVHAIAVETPARSVMHTHQVTQLSCALLLSGDTKCTTDLETLTWTRPKKGCDLSEAIPCCGFALLCCSLRTSVLGFVRAVPIGGIGSWLGGILLAVGFMPQPSGGVPGVCMLYALPTCLTSRTLVTQRFT